MNKLRKLNTLLLIALALVLVLAVAAACGGNETPETPKKDITGVTFENKSVTYDGNEHEITVSGTIPEGVSVSYTGNKGTDTGTYNATATLTGSEYKTLTLNATLTIVGQEITGVSLTNATVPYDKQPHSLTIANLPTGITATYTYNGQAVSSVTDYGEYTVVATLTGKGYNTKTLTATLTIEAKDITGVTFANRTETYTGNEYILELLGTLPTGVTYNITGDDAGTDAGTYHATAEIWGIGYKPLTLNATLTITPAEITGVTLTGDTVEYNGQPHSITVTGTLPTGVTVAYTYNGQSVSSATEVGTYTVVATISGKNYVTKVLTAELKIVNKLIKGVTFVDDTVTYDGNEHELTITTTSEFPQGITVKYENNKGTNAGTYNASVTLSGVGYEPQTLYATLLIEKATITGITLSNDSVEYDGLSHYIQVVGNVPAGVTTTYYYDDVEATSVTTVGKHEVRAVLSGPNHYTLELTAYLTITAKEEMLYSVYYNGYIYFQNNLDKNHLYRVSRNGNSLEKVSSDVASYFTTSGDNLFFYSSSLFSQTVKTFDENGDLSVAFNPGRVTYLTSDNQGYIYYSKANAIDTKHENGIYKVKLLDENGAIIEDSTAIRLTTDKADYLAFYEGFIYYSNNSDGGKLYRISVDAIEVDEITAGTKEKLTDEEVSDIIVDGGVVYFAQHKKISNSLVPIESTIERYNISTKEQIRLTIDKGAYLTKINDYIYYVNKDRLTTHIYGTGIFRVSVFGGDHEQVLEDDGNGYYSLATDGTYLYYYKLNDKHLYRYNMSTTGEADLMRNFEPVESTTFSASPYAHIASYNGEIYFTNVLDSNNLYKYNPQTKAIYKVLADSVSNVFFNGTYMYYSTHILTNYALWRLDLSNPEPEPEKISPHRYEHLIFKDGYIYALRVQPPIIVGQENTNRIVRLDLDGQNETELYKKKNVHITKLFLVDGVFHFTINPATGYKNIYTHALTEGVEEATDTNIRSDNFVIYGDKYYYVDQGNGILSSSKGLKICNLDGSDTKNVITGVDITDICEYAGKIYYTITTNNSKGIYVYDVANNTTTKLTDKVGHGLIVVDGQLYFENIALTWKADYPQRGEGDGHLYSINLSTKVETKVA